MPKHVAKVKVKFKVYSAGLIFQVSTSLNPMTFGRFIT